MVISTIKWFFLGFQVYVDKPTTIAKLKNNIQIETDELNSVNEFLKMFV